MADDRLTILSEYFYPESSATSQLLTELAAGLTGRFNVECITSHPNYHDEDREETLPRSEAHQGVEITRVRSTRFDKDDLLKRVVNWLTYTTASTIELLRSSSDVVLVVSNPPTLPLAPWVRKQLQGTPYVYLIHDLYPDIAVELGLVKEGGPVENLWKRATRRVLSDADQIVVLGESMRNSVLSRYPSVSHQQITVIHNWVEESFVEPLDKSENPFARENGSVEPFTIVYSGNIGRFHELETVVEAVDRLDQQGRDVKFLIIGEGAQKSELQTFVQENEIDPVEFLPFQPIEKLPYSLTSGDVSLVGIKEGMEGLCVSSKLYPALAAGQPVLAVVGEGDEVELVVNDCDSGIHVDPGDVEGCCETITRWMDNPSSLEEQGENARDCFENRFTFNTALQRYRSVLEQVTE
jgi:glycosyltransferase involved in cell wall biosynthesis